MNSLYLIENSLRIPKDCLIFFSIQIITFKDFFSQNAIEISKGGQIDIF